MGRDFVSVIMPVRNEARFIAQSLGSVLKQDYPPTQMEILVVDGMSTDETLAIIHALPGAARVRVLPNPQRIQAAALNIALDEARGDIIIRVDGHTVLASDYVGACVATLRETGADVVGGPMTPVGLTSLGKAIAAATTSKFGVPAAFHSAQGDQTGQFTDTVYLGAWPARVHRAIGGFDPSVHPNEDYEFNYRVRRASGAIFLSPRIQSAYYGRQTLDALARQYFAYGRSKTRTLRKFPASLRPRHLVAPAFTAALVLGAASATLSGQARSLWLLMLALYAFCDVAFSLPSAARRGWLTFWQSLCVFPTMHLAWGAGFWLGLAEQLRPEQPGRHAVAQPSSVGASPSGKEGK